MKKIKIIVFVLAVLLLFLLGGCAASNTDNNFIIDQQKSEIAQVQKQIILPVTNLFVEKDSPAMSQAMNKRKQILAQNNLSEQDDIIIAEVNGWPITLNEIAYCAGNREYWHDYMASSDDISDYETVFDTLVDEKIRLSQAQKLNILPSLDKVKEYNKQIEQSITSENNTDLIESIADYTTTIGITEEEYWQIYQVYQTYMFLAVDDLWKVIMQEGEDNGELEGLNKESKDDYYCSKIQEYKDTANIKILTDIPELQFQSVIDNVTVPHDTNLMNNFKIEGSTSNTIASSKSTNNTNYVELNTNIPFAVSEKDDIITSVPLDKCERDLSKIIKEISKLDSSFNPDKYKVSINIAAPHENTGFILFTYYIGDDIMTNKTLTVSIENNIITKININKHLLDNYKDPLDNYKDNVNNEESLLKLVAEHKEKLKDSPIKRKCTPENISEHWKNYIYNYDADTLYYQDIIFYEEPDYDNAIVSSDETQYLRGDEKFLDESISNVI